MNKILKTVLVYLPSVMIALFYIPNAIDKIRNPIQPDKIVGSSGIMITAGIFLLVSTGLFLYNKTMLLGTALLALYMTLIVLIHMYRGKPYEVVILILMATIFAAYIRKPNLFLEKDYA